MKIEKNKTQDFKIGDWVSTKQIESPSQSYTIAEVKKVLKKGSQLLVESGAYKIQAIVDSKKCKLIKRA
jgi:hypothetical protein